MNSTSPRRYPFPECDPPITEDASDIVQVGNLALTIDADIQDLYNTADDNLLTPDGCHLAISAPQNVVDGDYIVFNVVRFDNSPSGIMSDSRGIIIREDGTYLVTFWLNTTAPTLNNNGMGVIAIDGVGDRLFEGLGAYDAGSAVPGNNMSGSVMFRSVAGRLYRLRPKIGNSTATVTVANAEFVCVRMGPL